MRKQAKTAKSESKKFKTKSNGTGSWHNHPLATDQNIEQIISPNLGFVSAIQDHKRRLLREAVQERRENRRRTGAKQRASTQQTERMRSKISCRCPCPARYCCQNQNRNSS